MSFINSRTVDSSNICKKCFDYSCRCCLFKFLNLKKTPVSISFRDVIMGYKCIFSSWGFTHKNIAWYGIVSAPWPPRPHVVAPCIHGCLLSKVRWWLRLLRIMLRLGGGLRVQHALLACGAAYSTWAGALRHHVGGSTWPKFNCGILGGWYFSFKEEALRWSFQVEKLFFIFPIFLEKSLCLAKHLWCLLLLL